MKSQKNTEVSQLSLVKKAIMDNQESEILKKFASQFIGELIQKFIDVIDDCSMEDLHYVPVGTGNHIGFLAWHVMRSIDNVIFFAFDRDKPIWLQKKYNELMDLPKIDQGTDYSSEEANQLVIHDKNHLIHYCEDLAKAIDEKILNVDDHYLFEINKVVPWGEIPRIESIGKMMIAHGNEHLGEAQTILSITKNK
jgi:hypothetical protein